MSVKHGLGLPWERAIIAPRNRVNRGGCMRAGMSRRVLVGSAVAALAVRQGGIAQHAPKEGTPPPTPIASSTEGTGARLLTQFIDEVLDGRSIERIEAIVHRHIEYPSGTTIGIDEFTSLWSEENARRERLHVIDKFEIRDVMGDELWGLAFVTYSERTPDLRTWKLAYIARIDHGVIRELDVLRSWPVEG